MKIETTINNQKKELNVKNYTEPLLDVLRRHGYVGTKEGCRSGQCGACVVLVNGLPVNSCIYPAGRASGKKITTIEGIGIPNKLDKIQQSYLESGAVQCGYCTPGMILCTKSLLDKNPAPTDEEIKLALDGNLCRCTGYVKIIDAVKLAAKKLKKSSHR
ncbi:MAG: (2Fe-2S)-binding protein [Elusimicrobia bacterium]|nr:(2Fe-2S)-binding protein [Elusimicrobiota bacterium]